jgi:uncharacterized paraquat-inducible protein A
MRLPPTPGEDVVMVFTMFAVQSFDPRLMWHSESPHEAESKEITYA